MSLTEAQINGLLANAMSIPGFNIRHDLRSVNILKKENIETLIPVYTTILPAGTLLFRGIQTESQIFDDFLGNANSDTSEFCLPPNHNVFFYPFPFEDEPGFYKYMVICVLVRDVEVACYLSPVPLASTDKAIPENPLQQCDKVQYGCGISGNPYDPCFRKSFHEQNPTVTGIIALAPSNRKALLPTMLHGKQSSENRQNYNKFFSLYTDARSIVPGVPEIIMYPRCVRSLVDVKTPFSIFGGDFDYSDAFYDYIDSFTEYMSTQKHADGGPLYSYKPYDLGLQPNKRKMFDLISSRIALPDGATGANDRDYPIRIDKTTGFFVCMKYYRGSPENLIADKNRLGEAFAELKFKRGVLPLAPAPVAGPAAAGPAAAGPAAAGAVPPAGGLRHRRTRRKKRSPIRFSDEKIR